MITTSMKTAASCDPEYLLDKIKEYALKSQEFFFDDGRHGLVDFNDLIQICAKCFRVKGQHVKSKKSWYTGTTDCHFVCDKELTAMAQMLYRWHGGKLL